MVGFGRAHDLNAGRMAPSDASMTESSDSPQEETRIALRLTRRSGAAGDARRAVRRRFEGLLGTETLEDVLVVVSELVTNAVLYGRGDIDLWMACDSSRVKGQVADEGTGFAHGHEIRDPTRIGGNGLFMVDSIAERWGLRDGPTQVWFEIPAGRPN